MPARTESNPNNEAVEGDLQSVEGDLQSPVFSGVTIGAVAPASITSADGILTFIGTYEPISIGSEGDNTILYIGGGNNLYWPNGAMTIGCQRAYFYLNGITAGDPNADPDTDPNTDPDSDPNIDPSPVRAIVLNFGDDKEASGITTTDFTDYTDKAGAWYSLDGRKLNGKPMKSGVYVNGGRKVVIK